MTLPALPSQGSKSWYGYMQSLDTAVRGGGGGGGGGSSIGINVKDYGAVGNGTTDDSAAFASAASAAKAAARTIPYGLQSDPTGGVVINVPAGDYLITNPGAFLGDETMTGKAVGLTWRGAGKSISNIIFKPATASAMISNDYWQGLTFQDLGFLAATAGCTFMQSYTTHAAQAYTFYNCRWWYWKYAFDLQGSDNNSEYAFHSCDSALIETAGAFLFIGATNTSDQFLNYWFYGHKHWSTSAPLIDAAAGGHFHIYGLDVSNWGGALASTGYLFYLRGSAHAEGVTAFEVTGLRWEAMTSSCALLYSEWPQGNIALRSVDMTALVTTVTYGDIIKLAPSNTLGAILTVTDSHLAGGVRVVMAVNSYAYQPIIQFRNCGWRQRHSPSDVVSYDTSGTGGNTLPFPPVDFIACRGVDTDPYGAAGAAVWDARIGYRGALVQTLPLRQVSVRSTYGTPSGAGDSPKITLPLGAEIIGMEVMSPAGAVSTTATGWTWTLKTTEATPATVVSVVVPGAANAGFDVETKRSTPFLCDTAARATLTIVNTNVDQYDPGALLLIKGYW